MSLKTNNSCPVIVFFVKRNPDKTLSVYLTESGNRKYYDKGEQELVFVFENPTVVGDIRPGTLVRIDYENITGMEGLHCIADPRQPSDNGKTQFITYWNRHTHRTERAPATRIFGGKLTFIAQA